MRLHLPAIALLLFATAVRADHYDVFLVGGQSNCDGRGPAKDLTGPLASYVKPQEDVIIAYSCSKLRGPILESGGFKPLQPGWSVSPGYKREKGLPSPTFGPELAFGRAMADSLKPKKVAIIKYTEGGTNLAKQWNPDTKDMLYDASVAFTKKWLKDLKDRGHTYTIRGMIWHQGESDAALTADAYEKLLTTFIERMRKDLDAPDMAFGIGEVYDNKKRDTIRVAQKATAEKVKGAYFVPASDLKTYDGGTHFDAASQIELGKRFAVGMIKVIGK